MYTYFCSSPQVLESSYPVDLPTMDRLVDQALTLASFSDVAKDIPVLKEAAMPVPAGSAARYVYGGWRVLREPGCVLEYV